LQDLAITKTSRDAGQSQVVISGEVSADLCERLGASGEVEAEAIAGEWEARLFARYTK